MVPKEAKYAIFKLLQKRLKKIYNNIIKLSKIYENL